MNMMSVIQWYGTKKASKNQLFKSLIEVKVEIL